MIHIDSVDTGPNSSVVSGWIVDNGGKVVSAFYLEEETETPLEGFGLPSPDLVGAYGGNHENSRFRIQIPTTNLNGYLIFQLANGERAVKPLGKSSGAEDFVNVETHQIYEGAYFGRFKRISDEQIESIRISTGLPNEIDAVEVEGIKDENGWISLKAWIPESWTIDAVNVHFQLRSGEFLTISNPGHQARKGIQAYYLTEEFFRWVEDSQAPLKIVEIGSRARSNITRRERIANRHEYIGVDIKQGPNVDIVADAHELSQIFEPGSIDAIFGMAVFEHLAMPWKVAIEVNKVLRPHGRAMFLTTQSWPVHESPFDFFRFSKESWASLFNENTGFKILNAAVGDPARIISDIQTDATSEIKHAPGYLASTVYAEKFSETRLSWDVPVSSIYKAPYPA